MSRSAGDELGLRTVVVTGAGSGLGRSIALRLLADGYRCVLAGPFEPTLKETLELAGVDKERGTTVVCDVRAPDDRDRLIAHAVAQTGALFALVNNAGIARASPLFEETLEDWRDTFETNLEAAFFLSQQALEHMRARARGRIVNIASALGFMALNADIYPGVPKEQPGDRGPLRQSAYAGSKGGLIQLTRDLAAAVGGWNVTVNAVSPGNVPHPQYDQERTRRAREALRIHDKEQDPLTGSEAPKKIRLGDVLDKDTVDALSKHVPLGRLGRVEEIAGPVSFLLSDDAAYITGQNIVVDGGWSIW